MYRLLMILCLFIPTLAIGQETDADENVSEDRLQELHDLIFANEDELLRIQPGAYILGPDAASGEIVVVLPSEGSADADIVDAMEAALGAPVRVEQRGPTTTTFTLSSPTSSQDGVATVTVTEGAATPEGALSDEEIFEIDAQGIAEALEVPIERAREILEANQTIPAIRAELLDLYSDRIAGSYVEYEPTTRLVIRLTGTGEPAEVSRDVADGNLQVEFETGAAHTLEELYSLLETYGAQIPHAHVRYVDERTGEIVFEVEPDTAPSLSAADRAAEIESLASELFDAPIRIEEAPAMEQIALFGSGELRFAGAGWCTTSFAVLAVALNEVGVTTAGHCNSTSFSYFGRDGASHNPVSRVGWRANATTDLAWINNYPNIPVGPYFWAGVWRPVTGQMTIGNTGIGDMRCYYGSRSNAAACGQVTGVNISPGNSCGITQTAPCANAFVRIGNSASLNCMHGDSGGPVYLNQNASGVLTHGGLGQGQPCAYGPIERFNDLNLALMLYAP